MNNIYLPELVEITAIRQETADTKTFTLRFLDAAAWEKFRYRPGQFVEISVLGVGEAPFCLASARDGAATFEITARSVGAVTQALHSLTPGARLGARGPLGNGFALEEMTGRDLLFVGGGIGLPPLRPLIWEALSRRKNFGKMTVLYGARTPADLVYKEELVIWQASADMKCLITVDVRDEQWTGPVGVVGSLFPQANISPDKTVAFICGPPIMIRFVVVDLLKLGLTEDTIITTLERHMRCGVGKCNHCLIGDKYVCTDGPVFTYRQMRTMMKLV